MHDAGHLGIGDRITLLDARQEFLYLFFKGLLELINGHCYSRALLRLNAGSDPTPRRGHASINAHETKKAARPRKLIVRAVLLEAIERSDSAVLAHGANDHLGAGIEDQIFVAFDVDAPDSCCASKDQPNHRAFAAANDAPEDSTRGSADSAAYL